VSARIHRSEAPIPRAKRYAQRQRERLERDGQLALDLAAPPALEDPSASSRRAMRRIRPPPASDAGWEVFE
jgi:hypothetical protein